MSNFLGKEYKNWSSLSMTRFSGLLIKDI